MVMKSKDAVNAVFTRLAAGELSERVSLVQDGWEVDLPSGRTVARSTLQAEATALIAIGPDAVPHLLSWVVNENPALRYMAIYALEQITGEKSHLPYLHQSDQGNQALRAVEMWRKWYDARDGSDRGQRGL